MADDDIQKILLKNQEKILDRIAEISAYISAQDERNKHIQENRVDIAAMKVRLSDVEDVGKDYQSFKKDFKTTMWKILSPPLAALGILLFAGIGILLWLGI